MSVPDVVTGNRCFDEMTDEEFRGALRRIVATSEDEAEIRQRLTDLGCRYHPVISWRESITAVGMMASVLGGLLGGAHSQTGAMVMVMVYGPSGKIISV